MPIFFIGLINSDMQPPGVEVFYQLLFATGEGIIRYVAGLYLPRQALSVSQRLSRKVGVQLQLPHRLSSSVCLVLKLALPFSSTFSFAMASRRFLTTVSLVKPY